MVAREQRGLIGVNIKEGDAAWIGLLVYVVMYDAYAMYTGHETLSNAYYRALAHPRRRKLTIAVWVGLTAHLFQLIPRKYDPLAQLGVIATRSSRIHPARRR